MDFFVAIATGTILGRLAVSIYYSEYISQYMYQTCIKFYCKLRSLQDSYGRKDPKFIVRDIWHLDETHGPIKVRSVDRGSAYALSKISWETLELSAEGRYIVAYHWEDQQQIYYLPCDDRFLKNCELPTDGAWLEELSPCADYQIEEFMGTAPEIQMADYIAKYSGPFGNFYRNSPHQITHHNFYDLENGRPILKSDGFLKLVDPITEDTLVIGSNAKIDSNTSSDSDEME